VPVGVQRLEVLDGEGVPMAEFPQSLARMGPATSRLYSAVVDRLLSHDGSSGLARHVGNAVLKEDSRALGWPRSTRKTADGSTPPRRPSWPTTGPPCWPVTAA
jgi:phage terminase large subunit-like protein